MPDPARLTEPVPGVLRFADTCNVYALRCPDDASAAVLVDFGSGEILDHLRGAGIDTVRWIVHTHHHRDQCQGDHLAAARGIPIAVPETERHHFDRAEDFWENRQILHLYDVRNDYSTLTQSVPVAAELRDGEVFDAGGVRFEVVPTPGHTRGSVTLLATAGERRVAFCGDLVHAGGTVPTLYDLQYGYGSYEGLDLTRWSIRQLRRRGADVLLPSHGEPSFDVAATLDTAFSRLGRWWQHLQGFGGFSHDSAVEAQFRHITPHVLECTNTVAQFYVLLSETGDALFFDYGHMGPPGRQMISHTRRGERQRFLPHGIEELRALGMERVAVAIPTHMHDDHVIGMPWLQREFGTEVWAHESMRESLEQPGRYLIGCSNAVPVAVDRLLRHGERVGWHEFDIEVVHSPGHTEYASTLVVEDAGVRVAFTGDNYFRAPGAERDDIYHNVIFRNQMEADSHLRALDDLLPLRPDVIAPGHMGSFAITREQLLRHRARLEEQVEIYRDLVDGPVDYGVNPRWASLVPYTCTASPGGQFDVELEVRNYGDAPQRVEAALALPPGWCAQPAAAAGEAPPAGWARLRFSVAVPGDAPAERRRAIAADVSIDGRRRGQIAEAVVDVVAAAG